MNFALSVSSHNPKVIKKDEMSIQVDQKTKKRKTIGVETSNNNSAQKIEDFKI